MVPSEAGNPIDAVADLDLATADLAHREEMLRREYERNERLIAASSEHADATVGTATAEDGAIRIVVDANQRVVGVALDPRALRLGSIGRLEHAILDACQSAQDDVAHRLGRTTADPVQRFLDAMPELTQLLPPSAYAAFLEPDDPAIANEPEPTPQRPSSSTRPAERSIYE